MGKKYNREFLKRMAAIEHEINLINRKARADADKNTICNHTNICEIISIVNSTPALRTDVDLVENRAKELGYTFKNGNVNIASFLSDAGIPQSSYTRFKNGEQNLEWDTALKIVVGLELNEEDAERYLSSIGFCFKCWDKRDNLIQAYIRRNYFGDRKFADRKDFIWELIEYYNEYFIPKSENPIKHLFYKS